MENPIKVDDLGVPLFLATSIFLFSSLYSHNVRPSSHQVAPPEGQDEHWRHKLREFMQTALMESHLLEPPAVFVWRGGKDMFGMSLGNL